MDQEVEELKRLVQKNIAITDDTNRVVRSIRRSARWSTFFQFAWWIAIIAISGAAYYFYLQPYVDTIVRSYGSVQNFERQITNLFKNLPGQQTQSPSATAQ